MAHALRCQTLCYGLLRRRSRISRLTMIAAAVVVPITVVMSTAGPASAAGVPPGNVTCIAGGSISFNPSLSSTGTKGKKDKATVSVTLSSCAGKVPATPQSVKFKPAKLPGAAATGETVVGQCSALASALSRGSLKPTIKWGKGIIPTKATLSPSLLLLPSGGDLIRMTGTTSAGGPLDLEAFLTSTSTQALASCVGGGGGISSLNLDARSSVVTLGTFAPTVTSVLPANGPGAGGTAVTVNGTHFVPGTSGTTFSFGGSAGTGVDCATTTSCTVTSPSGSGTVDVRATTASGTSAIPAADKFTYIAVLTSGSPGNLGGANIAGGDELSVTAGGLSGFCSGGSADGTVNTNPATPGNADVSITSASLTGCSVSGNATDVTFNNLPYDLTIGDATSGGGSIGPDVLSGFNATAVVHAIITITCTYGAATLSGTYDDTTSTMASSATLTLISGGLGCPGTISGTFSIGPIVDSSVSGSPAVFVN